jgi:hypothetical protein
MNNDWSYENANKENVISFGYIFDKYTVCRISFYLIKY